MNTKIAESSVQNVMSPVCRRPAVQWLAAATIAAATIGVGLTGCGSTGEANRSSPGGADSAKPFVSTPGTPTASAGQSQGSQTVSAKPAASPVADAAKGVIAPKDAKYTIVCTTFAGPAHVQQARVSKDNLVNATGHREFYVVHDEAASTLYYGYYRERERSLDAAEAGRATKDMEYVRSLTDGEGRHLFGKSLLVPLPMPDPTAPPEYDLTRIDTDKASDDPERRYWSLAIADYSGDVLYEGKGRKQLAVESVIEARKQGYEAFYFHGPNTSTVCIGAWPRRAVREQEANEAHTDGDNGEELLVSSGPIPTSLTDQIKQSGRKVKVIQPKVDIDDPSLLAMMKEFPEYNLNGRPEVNVITDPKTGTKTRRPKQSFLVEIPKAQRESMLGGDRTGAEPGAISRGPGQPSNPVETGGPMGVPAGMPTGTGAGGRLRSVTP